MCEETRNSYEFRYGKGWPKFVAESDARIRYTRTHSNWCFSSVSHYGSAPRAHVAGKKRLPRGGDTPKRPDAFEGVTNSQKNHAWPASKIRAWSAGELSEFERAKISKDSFIMRAEIIAIGDE